MEIIRSSTFLKNYASRIKSNEKLVRQMIAAIETFIEDPNSESIANHELFGKMQGLWSFSINGDYRIIYKLSENGKVAKLLDIGTHEDVYYS